MRCAATRPPRCSSLPRCSRRRRWTLGASWDPRTGRRGRWPSRSFSTISTCGSSRASRAAGAASCRARACSSPSSNRALDAASLFYYIYIIALLIAKFRIPRMPLAITAREPFFSQYVPVYGPEGNNIIFAIQGIPLPLAHLGHGRRRRRARPRGRARPGALPVAAPAEPAQNHCRGRRRRRVNSWQRMRGAWPRPSRGNQCQSAFANGIAGGAAAAAAAAATGATAPWPLDDAAPGVSFHHQQ